MNLGAQSGIARKVGAILALIGAALALDRMTHMPASAPITTGNVWNVPIGSRLDLTGPGDTSLLQIETGAGEGMEIESGAARIDGAVPREAKALSWSVSKPAAGDSDNKVRLNIGLPQPAPGAIVSLQRTGDVLRPQLRISSPNAPLHIGAGVVFGDMLRRPMTSLLIDQREESHPIALGFVLRPGEAVFLTLPVYGDDTQKRLTMAVGSHDPLGPRLWLRRVEVAADGSTRPWKSACGAPAGKQLWPMLLRVTMSFHPDDCSSPRSLAAYKLAVDKDQLSIGLVGTAFVLSDDPPLSRWSRWIYSSPVLAGVLGLLWSGLAAWVVKTVRGKA